MKNLKIDKIEVFALNITLKEPISISLGTHYLAENVAIKIHADNGLVGTGEASPEINIVGETQSAEIEIAKVLAAGIKGKDPLAIEDRILDMDRMVDGNFTIKSAFDMALYDLLARQGWAGNSATWLSPNRAASVRTACLSIAASTYG